MNRPPSTPPLRSASRGTGWFASRGASFRFAARGLRRLSHEPNAKIHLAATFGVVFLGALLPLSRSDWALLAIAIAAVWIAEGLNTALELLCDASHPEEHPLVGGAKDVAAGAVLVAAVLSIVIATLVLGPHAARLLDNANGG